MIFGGYIALNGLIGSVLVFDSEINKLAHPHLFAVSEGKQISYEKIKDQISKNYPNFEIQRINTPDEASSKGVFVIRITEENEQKTVYMNPASGAINGSLDQSAFLTRLLDFHMSLLLANVQGEKIVGFFGGAFFILLLSGLYLWWPGIKKWNNGFKYRKKKNNFIRNYDIHKLVGIFALPLLLILSLTGALFAYEQPLFKLFGSEASIQPDPQLLISKPLAKGEVSLDEIIESAKISVPKSVVTQIRLPENGSQGVVEVRLSRNYDPGTGNIQIWVDPYDGEIVQKLDPKNDDGLTYQIWHRPLHTGGFGGLSTKILYALVGITPMILFITGIKMWRFKKRKKKK